MIRYRLVCEAGHGFESWFPSSASYDDQVARGFVACPICGSAQVSKGVMAPSVARGGPRPAEAEMATVMAEPPSEPSSNPAPLLAEPERKIRAMLRALRQHVTSTSDDVGARFPEEARRMHYGETPSRPIYGEASAEEAQALVEEGIDVAPLPPMPDDRN